MGRGVVRTVGGGFIGVLDTWFAGVGGVNLVRPKACCQVSSLERRLLRSRRLQFTSAASPVR